MYLIKMNMYTTKTIMDSYVYMFLFVIICGIAVKE